jgi:hypothetical protein
MLKLLLELLQQLPRLLLLGMLLKLLSPRLLLLGLLLPHACSNQPINAAAKFSAWQGLRKKATDTLQYHLPGSQHDLHACILACAARPYSYKCGTLVGLHLPVHPSLPSCQPAPAPGCSPGPGQHCAGPAYTGGQGVEHAACMGEHFGGERGGAHGPWAGTAGCRTHRQTEISSNKGADQC